jgi:competence protein ComEA
VELRRQRGRFQSVEELLDVHGIGPKRLEQIRPYVVVR